jgi:hypothetical protein
MTSVRPTRKRSAGSSPIVAALRVHHTKSTAHDTALAPMESAGRAAAALSTNIAAFRTASRKARPHNPVGVDGPRRGTGAGSCSRAARCRLRPWGVSGRWTRRVITGTPMWSMAKGREECQAGRKSAGCEVAERPHGLGRQGEEGRDVVVGPGVGRHTAPGQHHGQSKESGKSSWGLAAAGSIPARTGNTNSSTGAA